MKNRLFIGTRGYDFIIPRNKQHRSYTFVNPKLEASMKECHIVVGVLFTFIYQVAGFSRFERNVNMDHVLVLDTASTDMGYTSFVNCSRLCHEDGVCRSLTFQQTTGRCHLFPKTFLEPERRTQRADSRTFRKTDDNAVCEIPSSITKGRLLSIDGQQEGSRAWFNCDENHFPGVSFGECSAGAWIGLDNPCLYKGGPSYFIPLEERMKTGLCVMMNLLAPSWSDSPALRLKTANDIALSTSFRINTEVITRNSLIGGNWGIEETDIPFWPLVNNEIFNFTLCIEEELLKGYVDTAEMFTFNHRLPITDITQLEIRQGMIARLVAFTE